MLPRAERAWSKAKGRAKEGKEAVCVCICAYACIGVYKYVYACVYTCMYVYACMCVCMCVHYVHVRV